MMTIRQEAGRLFRRRPVRRAREGVDHASAVDKKGVRSFSPSSFLLILLLVDERQDFF